ncbi:MAG: GNAT family N-acetyltransferase, partial [Nitrososphaera sp.]|nr:GNAT family N-acetyltransferase [Nitrososphaera sp.]
MKDIQKQDWGQISSVSFPFSDYEYLLALETSQSVGGATGWIPYYVTVWRGSELVGANCAYLKTNSYGEYIFDWAWVAAYHRFALPYYPKLVSAIPFTPATGAKILLHPHADRVAVSHALISAMLALAEEHGCHSVHGLFLPPEEVPHFADKGFLIRHSFQYHWFNREYRDFSDFLDHLKTRRRKQIV